MTLSVVGLPEPTTTVVTYSRANLQSVELETTQGITPQFGMSSEWPGKVGARLEYVGGHSVVIPPVDGWRRESMLKTLPGLLADMQPPATDEHQE